MGPKMDMIIKTDQVIDINGKEATVPFNGRGFTCCIHSDLPGALESMKIVRAAVDAAK